MSIPEIQPSELHLDGLTEAECGAIFKVLQRDTELRRQESERLRILRAEVNQLQSSSTEFKASANHDKVCPLCHIEFGWLFHRGDLCPRCQVKVCDRCSEAVTSKYKWLCTLCSKQMQLKARSGAWFYSKFRRSRRRIRENGEPTKREDTPDPFARRKHPQSDDKTGNVTEITNLDTVTKPKVRIESTDGVKRLSASDLKSHHVGNIKFPEESDKKLLAELIVTKKCSPSVSTPNGDFNYEKDLLFCEQKRFNNSSVKTRDESLRLPQQIDLKSFSKDGGRSRDLQMNGLMELEHDLRIARLNPDTSGTTQQANEAKEDLPRSTETLGFHPKSTTRSNHKEREDGKSAEAEYICSLERMPVAQSQSIGLSSNTGKPNRKSSDVAIPSVIHKERNPCLAETKGKLDTIPLTREIGSQFSNENYLKASKQSMGSDHPLNQTLNSNRNQTRVKDETDSRDLANAVSSKTAPLNISRSFPGSISTIGDAYDDFKDEDSLSVISEKTEPQVELDITTDFSNSSDCDVNSLKCKKLGMIERQEVNFGKGMPCPSLTDEDELDLLINELAYNEVLLTGNSMMDEEELFNSITKKKKVPTATLR